MDVDLIIKNANLSNDQTGVDIACKDGVIISIERGINANAKKTIDAQGHLVSPPFVDPHFHMDATLSLGTPRMNVSGTLLEGISLWSELKPIQNVEQIIDRALRYCDLAVSMGIGAIRSHVDICDNSLKGVEALLEVQRKVAPYIELQLVAFPQDGIFRDPNAKVNLINALDMGVNVVGGIPHFERTMQDGADSVKFLCDVDKGPASETLTKPLPSGFKAKEPANKAIIVATVKKDICPRIDRKVFFGAQGGLCHEHSPFGPGPSLHEPPNSFALRHDQRPSLKKGSQSCVPPQLPSIFGPLKQGVRHIAPLPHL